MDGSEGICRRLLEKAQFTPVQLRIVEYLMNEAAEGAFTTALDRLNTLIATDELRVSFATEDGDRRVELNDKVFSPELNLHDAYAKVVDGWRGRFTAIPKRQAELARSVGVEPSSLDTFELPDDEA